MRNVASISSCCLPLQTASSPDLQLLFLNRQGDQRASGCPLHNKSFSCFPLVQILPVFLGIDGVMYAARCGRYGGAGSDSSGHKGNEEHETAGISAGILTLQIGRRQALPLCRRFSIALLSNASEVRHFLHRHFYRLPHQGLILSMTGPVLLYIPIGRFTRRNADIRINIDLLYPVPDTFLQVVHRKARTSVQNQICICYTAYFLQPFNISTGFDLYTPCAPFQWQSPAHQFLSFQRTPFTSIGSVYRHILYTPLPALVKCTACPSLLLQKRLFRA